jgi:hypothetical protein
MSEYEDVVSHISILSASKLWIFTKNKATKYSANSKIIPKVTADIF